MSRNGELSHQRKTGNPKLLGERRLVRRAGDQEGRSEQQTQLMHNEGGTCPPSLFDKDDVGSDLSVNHRYDSERAGIHDEDLIADQDVFITAILRGIFHDRNRQHVKMHCSGNNFADLG